VPQSRMGLKKPRLWRVGWLTGEADEPSVRPRFARREPKIKTCDALITLDTTKEVVVSTTTVVGDNPMSKPKLSRLELKIMDAVWSRKTASIREIQEAFPASDRPAYTTIQTVVYRLEAKKAVRRVKKVGNFHVFEAAVSRDMAQRKLIDDLLALFEGRTQPVMAHLIESGQLTLGDVKEAEKLLRKLSKEGKAK
jgi:BlaI family transcriptional regulator, penicillinase repressor